jgi:hypothetical protein
MEFAELVALLRDPGENGLPDTIYDDLSSSYSLAVDGGTAKAAELQTANSSLTGEIDRLKALNFDLLMAAAGESSTETTDDKASEKNSDNTVESLFDKD